jgi:hypothetical protein
MTLALVPQVGQNLENTQAPILQNFTVINGNFDVDHVEFNSGGDSGKHKKITFPVLYTTIPPITPTSLPAFNANEQGLFAAISDPATDTGTGVNEIFVFKNPSFGGGLGSQRFSITENRGNKAGEVAASYSPPSNIMDNTKGYVTLPNGTFMQWCIVNTGTSGTVTQFNWPIPFVGYVFNIQLTQVGNGAPSPGPDFGQALISHGMPNILQQFRIQQKDNVSRRYMVLGIGTRY